MKIAQPCVFRLHFHTEEQVQSATDRLDNLGVFSDVMVKAKPDQLGAFKLIFVLPTVKEAKSVLARTKLNQLLVEVFDPMRDWSSEFTTVR
jgi:hypothetical protein